MANVFKILILFAAFSFVRSFQNEEAKLQNIKKNIKIGDVAFDQNEETQFPLKIFYLLKPHLPSLESFQHLIRKKRAAVRSRGTSSSRSSGTGALVRSSSSAGSRSTAISKQTPAGIVKPSVSSSRVGGVVQTGRTGGSKGSPTFSRAGTTGSRTLTTSSKGYGRSPSGNRGTGTVSRTGIPSHKTGGTLSRSPQRPSLSKSVIKRPGLTSPARRRPQVKHFQSSRAFQRSLVRPRHTTPVRYASHKTGRTSNGGIRTVFSSSGIISKPKPANFFKVSRPSPVRSMQRPSSLQKKNFMSPRAYQGAGTRTLRINAGQGTSLLRRTNLSPKPTSGLTNRKTGSTLSRTTFKKPRQVPSSLQKKNLMGPRAHQGSVTKTGSQLKRINYLTPSKTNSRISAGKGTSLVRRTNPKSTFGPTNRKHTSALSRTTFKRPVVKSIAPKFNSPTNKAIARPAPTKLLRRCKRTDITSGGGSSSCTGTSGSKKRPRVAKPKPRHHTAKTNERKVVHFNYHPSPKNHKENYILTERESVIGTNAKADGSAKTLGTDVVRQSQTSVNVKDLNDAMKQPSSHTFHFRENGKDTPVSESLIGKHFVSGHMTNRLQGGRGSHKNTLTITKSMNTKMSNKFESPSKEFIDDAQKTFNLGPNTPLLAQKFEAGKIQTLVIDKDKGAARKELPYVKEVKCTVNLIVPKSIAGDPQRVKELQGLFDKHFRDKGGNPTPVYRGTAYQKGYQVEDKGYEFTFTNTVDSKINPTPNNYEFSHDHVFDKATTSADKK